MCRIITRICKYQALHKLQYNKNDRTLTRVEDACHESWENIRCYCESTGRRNAVVTAQFQHQQRCSPRGIRHSRHSVPATILNNKAYIVGSQNGWSRCEQWCCKLGEFCQFQIIEFCRRYHHHVFQSETAMSSAERRWRKLLSANLNNGHESTMWFILCGWQYGAFVWLCDRQFAQAS